MTRLLIVEHDPSHGRALARSVERRRPDITAVRARDGAEAIRVMSQGSVDLLLTELALPELDGFQLLAWAGEHHPEVPAFAMSTSGSDETKARVSALGAVAYFEKPLDVKELVARLSGELSQTVRGQVYNITLASFLQLMEMERKTCTLSVSYAGKTGTLLLRRGQLVDAAFGDQCGEQAAITIIAWPYPTITISSTPATEPPTIEKPLGFVIMEAMRVQDELVRDVPASEFPMPGAHSRPSSVLVRDHLSTGLPAFPPSCDFALSRGVQAVAVADTSTGTVLSASTTDGFPIGEFAGMAAYLLRQQAATIKQWSAAEGVEEVVVSTKTRCDVIRPLGAGATQLAVLVFAPGETNLIMARLDLERFIFTRGGY
jgi:DNA-binding response OmpR family regulator